MNGINKTPRVKWLYARLPAKRYSWEVRRVIDVLTKLYGFVKIEILSNEVDNRVQQQSGHAQNETQPQHLEKVVWRFV